MDEYKMMLEAPFALYTYYMNLVKAGEVLSDDQVIKLAYLETLFVGES